MKRISYKSVLLLFLFIQTNSFAQNTDRPKVGLVLSGGGARGFAHIGVLEVLEKEGIPIDYIVGTSMGSIMGGLYSIGYSSDQLREFATSQQWINLLSDYISREYVNLYEKNELDRYIVSFLINADAELTLPAGVVQGQNVINTLCELTAKYHDTNKFDDLPIPFACVAADIVTGEQVVLREGFLPEAIFSSMSIPTIFAPTEINGQLLVDGGIINNYPVDVAKSMGADIIIGVDIQTKPLGKEQIVALTDILGQMLTYMGNEKYIENKKQTDILIEPDITGYNIASFSNASADTLIRRGRESTLLKVDEIKSLLAANNIPLNHIDRTYEFNQDLDLNYWIAGGLKETTVKYIQSKSNFSFPGKYNFFKIKEGIKRLYGTKAFDKVYFRIYGDENKSLGIQVKEKNTSILNAGFNFNSTDKASILLNLTLRNKLIKGSRLSIDTKLSKNTNIGASYQINLASLPEIHLGALFKNLNVDVYQKDSKVASSDVSYLAGEVSFMQLFGSNYLMNAGIEGEYYKLNPLYNETVEVSRIPTENSIISVFGKIRFDNLDNKFYPTKGFDLYTKFSYTLNKADNIIKNSTTPILYYNLKSAVSLGSDVCFLPSVYGRLLLNDNSDLFRSNAIGGTEVEKLLEYHLPFVGVKRVVLTKDKTLVARGELRLRLNDYNFLSLILNGATHFNSFSDWKTKQIIGGIGVNYSYNSFIGPIDVLLSTSDYTDEVEIFVNIGKWF